MTKAKKTVTEKKLQTSFQDKVLPLRAVIKKGKAHKKALSARLKIEIENLPPTAKRNRLLRLGGLQEGCGSHEPLVVPKPTVPEDSEMDFGLGFFNLGVRDGTLLKLIFHFDLLDLWYAPQQKIGNAVEILSRKIWEHRNHGIIKTISSKIWKHRKNK